MIRAHSRLRHVRRRKSAIRETYVLERRSRGVRDAVAVAAHVNHVTRAEVCEYLGLDPRWAFDRAADAE